MSAIPIVPCVRLDWDSQFFERRIGKVVSNCLNSGLVETITEWTKKERIECLYFLCNCADHESINTAGRSGFQLVDIRVTFERKLEHPPCSTAKDIQIRNACLDDIHHLKELARISHTDSRFYTDTNFSKDSCDRLYETWIEKSCRDSDGCVFVAIVDEHPVGYVSCSSLDGQEGNIGLIAVSPEAQGRGIGAALLDAGERWFIEHGCTIVSVVTQGSNIRAQRLYQRRGFVVRSMQLWFHRWS